MRGPKSCLAGEKCAGEHTAFNSAPDFLPDAFMKLLKGHMWKCVFELYTVTVKLAHGKAGYISFRYFIVLFQGRYRRRRTHKDRSLTRWIRRG